MINFTLNGKEVSVDAPDDTPLLWVLRDDLRLTGTKFGCGIAQCGACTVELNGMTRRSCVTPLSMVEGSYVTTIEGVDGPEAKAVQAAWEAIDVRHGPAARDPEPHGRGYRQCHGRQHLPLRHLCPYPRGDQERRQRAGGVSHDQS